MRLGWKITETQISVNFRNMKKEYVDSHFDAFDKEFRQSPAFVILRIFPFPGVLWILVVSRELACYLTRGA